MSSTTTTPKTASAPKAPRASKASKNAAAAAVAEVPVPAPAPVVSEPVVVPEPVAASTEAESGLSLSEEFNQVVTQLTSVRTLLAGLTSQVRQLQRRSEKELRTAQKSGKKVRKTTGNRNPSGFVKPTPISDALAAFLKKPAGTQMARTEVTREINQYIRAHNLQDPQNGRKINPDKDLRKLLNVEKNGELTYFNLQRYMSPHFIKTAAATTASASQ
uniref:DM2 domain-containing protein n=1 Tax=viral metagenome TaxID=1070528 RepID=A0A6C0BT83_9ZZZZ